MSPQASLSTWVSILRVMGDLPDSDSGEKIDVAGVSRLKQIKSNQESPVLTISTMVKNKCYKIQQQKQTKKQYYKTRVHYSPPKGSNNKRIKTIIKKNIHLYSYYM